MIEILVLLEVKDLENKEVFEKHNKKEGFIKVPNEEYVYTAESSTTTFATKAYILEVFAKAMQKGISTKSSLVFLLNETPYPNYTYDEKTKMFDLAESTAVNA